LNTSPGEGKPMIRFWCQCGRQLQAGEFVLGRAGRCPACGHVIIIPLTRAERFAQLLAALAEKDQPQPKPGINECGEIIRGRAARLSWPAGAFRVIGGWVGWRPWSRKG